MKIGYCRGCGSVLQSENKQKPGYIPPEALERNGALICQRCFRVTHYDDIGTNRPEPVFIRQSIIKAITDSELLVLVADFSDLTGSLPVWLNLLGEKPFILALNKTDLLPSRTKPEEVTAYLKQYLQTLGMHQPNAIVLVSGLKSKGISYLSEQIRKSVKQNAKVAFLGVANVGKSSLVKSFLTAEGSNLGPTVSRYPGTTMGLSNWSIFRGRNTLIDTPGLNPGDRYSDLLCPGCACSLLPHPKLQQKLWSLNPSKGLLLGSLFGIESLATEEVVAIAFSSPNIKSHRTDNAKVLPFLHERPEWLSQLCGECGAKMEWVTETIAIESNMDLGLAGLGWISLRKVNAEYKIHYPKGIRWEIRPALIGKKDEST